MCEVIRKPSDNLTIAGRQTWISKAWNEGTLTKEWIAEELAEMVGDLLWSDDEWREALRRTEQKVAFEEYMEQRGRTYEEVLNECVERRLESIQNDRDYRESCADALGELLANWSDDHEALRPFVCCAHLKLDAYCRWLDPQ